MTLLKWRCKCGLRIQTTEGIDYKCPHCGMTFSDTHAAKKKKHDKFMAKLGACIHD